MDSIFGKGSKNNVSKALRGEAPSISELRLPLERQRFQNRLSAYSKANPRAKLFWAGAGALSFFMASLKGRILNRDCLSIFKGYEYQQSLDEIARRKQQLSLPVYELSSEESTQFPWGPHNIDEWLFRPVQITGRPIHYKAMMIPRKVNGYNGYDYILPLVTKENEDGSVQEGILLNKGWIPEEYYYVSSRMKLEDASEQTFVGYVTKNTELHHKFGDRGNDQIFLPEMMNSKRKGTWNNVYLNDMCKHAGFKNYDQSRVALIECVVQNTPMNERSLDWYNYSLDQKEDYPYKKTHAGALQTDEMPWSIQKSLNNYFTFGTASVGIAALLTLV